MSRVKRGTDPVKPGTPQAVDPSTIEPALKALEDRVTVLTAEVNALLEQKAEAERRYALRIQELVGRREDLLAQIEQAKSGIEALKRFLPPDQSAAVRRQKPKPPPPTQPSPKEEPARPARGRTIRSKNMTTEERAEAVRLAQGGKGVREIARHFNRAPSTISRRLKEERAQAAQRGA